MATVSFTSFLPEVTPQVPGCSDPLAVNALRNAAVEFCNLSMYWQERQDAVSLTATDFPYDLEAPAGARVCQILHVSVEGTPIEPIALDTIETFSNWQTLTSSMPIGYYQPNPNQFALFPLPDSAKLVTLRTAYSPLRTATGIDEYVYQNQLEVIAAGALARLMAMPGQAFTNPELGLFYRSKFMQGVTDAIVEANKSFNRAPLTVAMRPLV